MFKKITSHQLCSPLSLIIFVGTVIFQMAINGAFAADFRQEERQFSIEVSGVGEPIILIPGLMSDSTVWEELVSKLDTMYQVHTISIAGFASTPAIQSPSLNQVKHQLLAYIDQNQLENPSIIGHSLGGFMALWMASSQPEKIGPVISIDGLPFIGPVFTGTNSSTVTSLSAQAKQIKNMYNNITRAQLIEQSRYTLSRQATSEESKSRVMEMVKASDPKTVGEAIYTLMSTDLRADIANITSPLLLLGASGGFTTDAQKLAMKTLYQQQINAKPEAKLVMNTTARHFIMFDDPKWLEQQVIAFLGD